MLLVILYMKKRRKYVYIFKCNCIYSLVTQADIQFATFATYGNFDTLFVTFAT